MIVIVICHCVITILRDNLYAYVYIVCNSSKKEAANQCYEDIRKTGTCDFLGPIQDLIIGQFLPMVCPVIQPELPASCY